MKYLSILICFFMVSPILAGKIKLSLFDELEPLYEDVMILKEDTTLEIDCPKNSVAGFHLVIKNLGEINIIDIIEKEGEAFPELKLFLLIAVPVEENTGLDSRTEQWDGKTNPYVVRRAPFRIYEVLAPVEFPYLSDEDTRAFRLQWTIPENVKPGEYKRKIRVKTMEEVRNVEVLIRIHDVSVPKLSENTYGYTNWFSIGNIAEYHGVELWSDDFYSMLSQYAQLMAYGRQNMFFVPLKELVDVEDNKPVFDTVKMHRYVSVFNDAGLKKVEFSHFAFRTDHDWSSKTLSSVFDKDMLVNSEEGREFYRNLFEGLGKIIKKYGWEGRCGFHVSDEPTNEVAEDYKEFVKFFREYFPKGKILEATMTEELVGAVDIWTPQLQEFQEKRDFYKGLKEDGAEVWVYSCLVPGGKWLNRLLDQEKLRQVYIGWSLPFYDLDGFLHWGLNHYNTANPFTLSVVDHPHAPKTNNKLPAGDTRIVYPGPKGPLSSIRFEAHRIGMEDAELLRILKGEKKKEFYGIVKKAFRSFRDYETSVEKYRKTKKEILKAL